MDNYAENKSYNLKIYILCFVVALTTFSCGPRSGIHKDNDETSQENTQKGTQFICGNAIQESNNIEWANKTLGINSDGYKGQKLFKQNCAVCHFLNDQKLTGSGLKGVFDRVPKPEIEWLKNYILNSEKYINQVTLMLKSFTKNQPVL